MAIDLGRFEDVGFADVIYTGKSREEMCRVLKANAKKFGIKLKINYVPKSPVGSVVLDTRTGRLSIIQREE